MQQEYLKYKTQNRAKEELSENHFIIHLRSERSFIGSHITSVGIVTHLFNTAIIQTLYVSCIYRHPNRDVVLAHVRGHYHEAGLLIEDKNQTSSLQLPLLNIPKPNELNNTVYMNNILSMCLSPNAGKLLQQQMQNGASPIPGMLSIPMVTPAIKNIPSSGTGTVATSSTNKHGETDEASSGGTSVVNGGWRGPAPYRCGFCHQVSNWKHVIQVYTNTPISEFHSAGTVRLLTT